MSGLLAAARWYRSARTLEPGAAANWNRRAALTTVVSVGLQAVALAIDMWAPPVGGWG